MKYFKDPLTNKDYRCSDIFNYVAVDYKGSLWLYQRFPKVRECDNYFSSSRRSYNLRVIQRYGHHVENWKNTVVNLNNCE